MDTIPRRSFLEVYYSENEEIADVNVLQKEFEDVESLSSGVSTDSESIDSKSININNNYASFKLEIGMIYNSVCFYCYITKALLF
jgi:hypothetical protein